MAVDLKEYGAQPPFHEDIADILAKEENERLKQVEEDRLNAYADLDELFMEDHRTFKEDYPFYFKTPVYQAVFQEETFMLKLAEKIDLYKPDRKVCSDIFKYYEFQKVDPEELSDGAYSLYETLRLHMHSGKRNVPWWNISFVLFSVFVGLIGRFDVQYDYALPITIIIGLLYAGGTYGILFWLKWVYDRLRLRKTKESANILFSFGLFIGSLFILFSLYDFITSVMIFVLLVFMAVSFFWMIGSMVMYWVKKLSDHL